MIDFIKLVKDLEIAKVGLLTFVEEVKHKTIDEDLHDDDILATFNFVNPVESDDIKFYMFYFEDNIPSYRGDTKDKEYGRSIARYYNLSISRQLSQMNEKLFAEKFLIVIDQKFKGRYRRDLDNRNRKLIIDAIKNNHLIDDDTVDDITILENGKLNASNSETVVFVVPINDSRKFLEKYYKGDFASEINFRRDITLKSNSFPKI